jgi:hypothetical protein
VRKNLAVEWHILKIMSRRHNHVQIPLIRVQVVEQEFAIAGETYRDNKVM